MNKILRPLLAPYPIDKISIDKLKTHGAVVEMTGGENPNDARWMSMIREVKQELCTESAGGTSDASFQAAIHNVNFWMRRVGSPLFQVTG